MGLVKKASDQGDKLTVGVDGEFNYKYIQEFKQLYKDVVAPVKEFHVDLTTVTHMDSAAIGMLLCLKDKADNIGGKVVLLTKSEHIDDIIRLACLEQIFEVQFLNDES